MSRSYLSLLILLNFLILGKFTAAYAQDAVLDTAKVTNTDVKSSEDQAEVAVTRVKHRDRAKNTKYTKSRYTTDRTEKDADHVELTLAMGIDKIIDLDYDGELRKENFYVGNTSVVMVQPVLIGKTKKQLVIKPTGAGETTIAVRDVKGNVPVIFHVVVAQQNLVRIIDDLKRNLQEVEGVNIRVEANRVILEGEAITPNDYGKVINVVSDPLYVGMVSNRVTMSNVTLVELSKRIQSDIQMFAPSVQVQVLNGRLILEGTTNTEASKNAAGKRAELYLPNGNLSEPISKAANYEKNEKPLQLIQNFIVVTPDQPKRESKLVRITVHFVELSKDFLKAFGFKWQPGFTSDPSISIGQNAAGQTASTGGFTFAGTLSSLFPSLNSVQSAGYGRILKSANAVGKSGEEITLKDLQSIQTTSIAQNGATAVGAPIQVGFSLAVTPTILQGQDVDLSMALEQTNVISKGSNGLPITATHSMKSRVYVRSSEVVAVTAVNKQELSSAFNRDDPNPGSFGGGGGQAAAAPTKPLWSMIRSKNFSKNKGEFVVFVSPEIIENASDGTQDIKKNYRIKAGR